MSADFHGFRDATYDNIAGGWRMECSCGFETGPGSMAQAGEELEEHWLAQLGKPGEEPQK
jgi:hypothetical protein